jgi:hypothetical protein
MNMQGVSLQIKLEANSSGERKYITDWAIRRRNVESKNIIWIYLVAIYISSIDKESFYFSSFRWKKKLITMNETIEPAR